MEDEHLEEQKPIQQQPFHEHSPQTVQPLARQQTKQQLPKKQTQENHDEQENTLISAPHAVPQRKFGNYIKIMDNSFITLAIGPDYLCFLPTFLLFALMGFLLIRYINHNVENIYAIIITHIVCIGQALSYLVVGLSDPGIAYPLSQQEKRSMGRTSFCRKCRFDVPPKTFHCVYCDVCIIGYDHHCPWTSKCIGRKNIVSFYIFLFYTPIFIVYAAFAFGFALDPTPRTQHLRTDGK